MKKTIRFSKREELKALPILHRHSPGVVLPNQTYIVESSAVDALRDAGVRFTEVASTANAPTERYFPDGKIV